MAEDHLGPRPARPGTWTKLFTAFRVALDAKKLLLAAAGILAMALGWWVLALLFYTPRGLPVYEPDAGGDAAAQWAAFKARRAHWNLLHELAGPPVTARLVNGVRVVDHAV